MQNTVLQLSDLVKLELSSERQNELMEFLNKKTEEVNSIKNVNVKDVNPTIQPVDELKNVMESDEILTDETLVNELIQLTSLPTQARQIMVKNVF